MGYRAEEQIGEFRLLVHHTAASTERPGYTGGGTAYWVTLWEGEKGCEQMIMGPWQAPTEADTAQKALVYGKAHLRKILAALDDVSALDPRRRAEAALRQFIGEGT